MKRLLFLFSVAIFFSCSKSNETNTPPAITMESLAGDYKITSAKANIGGASTDVLSLYYPACQQDDIYHLKADGTYTVTDEGVACDPSSATSGEWSLNDKKITIGTDLEFTITSYDGKSLNGTSSITLPPPISLTADVAVVFTKQ